LLIGKLLPAGAYLYEVKEEREGAENINGGWVKNVSNRKVVRTNKEGEEEGEHRGRQKKEIGG